MSARILVSEPHLTAQALLYLDRRCRHEDATSWRQSGTHPTAT